MSEKMTFEIASLEEASGPQEFVDFWSARYSNEVGEEYYWNNAQWPEDDDLIWEHFENLLRWKEQARFRQGAVERVGQRKEELLWFMKTLHDVEAWDERDIVADVREAQMKLKTDRIVRPVLACHYARPEQFPLYDQHVWRAWGRIAGWLKREHFSQEPRTPETYAEYRAFALGLARELGGSSVEDLRCLDKALMAFGQSLLGEGERLWADSP